MNKIDKIKQHFRNHKDTYFLVGKITVCVLLPIGLPVVVNASSNSTSIIKPNEETKIQAITKRLGELNIILDNTKSPASRALTATKIGCCTSALILSTAGDYLPFDPATKSKLAICCGALMVALEFKK